MPEPGLFPSFEKLDGCFTVMGDDHPCNVEGMGTVTKLSQEVINIIEY